MEEEHWSCGFNKRVTRRVWTEGNDLLLMCRVEPSRGFIFIVVLLRAGPKINKAKIIVGHYFTGEERGIWDSDILSDDL